MHTPTRTAPRSFRTTALALLAAPALLVALVACSPTDAPAKTPGAASTAGGFEDWSLAYASCMRDEGIDMPDPDGEDRGGASIVKEGTDPAAFEAADEVCQGELGAPPAPPGGKKTAEDYFDQELEAAKCMRGEGFDVPDPVVGKGFNPGMDIPEDVLKKCLSSFEQVK